MLLSVVSGTFNRRHYLALMLDSIRQQLPKGMADVCEFIIVDGGSTDDTLDYCRSKRDIRLIEDGALLGAISAFSRGARMARGEYVLLANDDVIFRSDSILRAIQHLETHPACAAVAFADNRTSIVNGDGKQYRTEGMGATLADGRRTMVTYAQVGMFRREPANEAGWWGDQDDVMSKSKTYGGDNFLSSHLWEMGYTVDPVDGCVIDDLIVRDELREHHKRVSTHDSDAYYERYPTVNIPAKRVTLPVSERMRVLFLPIYEAGHPQAANKEKWLTEAFQDIGALVCEVDYLNSSTDWLALAKAWQPNLVLTQIQGVGDRLTVAHLKALRAVCPGVVIVNWNGDAHMDGLTSPAMLNLLREVDIQTTINAMALPVYEREGIPAAYWQIAYREPVGNIPDVPAWDVLYQANWYAYREPLFEMLDSLPYRVGMYGNHAKAVGNTHYDFAAQAALYAKATITVGDTFPFSTRAFVSNRMFQALRAGAFMLQQHSEALEEYTGLTPGVHYVEWSDVNDLRVKIDEWLKPGRAAERAQIAEAGRAFVWANFSPAAQVRKLLTEIIPSCMGADHGRTEPVARDYAVAATWMD